MEDLTTDLEINKRMTADERNKEKRHGIMYLPIKKKKKMSGQGRSYDSLDRNDLLGCNGD